MLIAIRRHNAEFDEMCDLKTLKQWARTGEVHPNDLIKEDGEWVPASKASVLKGFFAVAAWDVSEDVLWTPQLSQRDHQSKSETDSKTTVNKDTSSSLQESTSHNIYLYPKSRRQTESVSVIESTEGENNQQDTDFDHAVEREYFR